MSPDTRDEDEVKMPLHVNTNGHKPQPQRSPAVKAESQRSPAVQAKTQPSPMPNKSAQKSPAVSAPPIIQPQVPSRAIDTPSKNENTMIDQGKPKPSSVSARLNRNAQLRNINSNAGGASSASSQKSIPDAVAPPKPATPEIAKPTTIYPHPANNTQIIITYVINHRKLYIRSGETEASQDYLRTLLDCAEFEKTAPPMRGLPSKGDILLARFEGQFYRALVLNVISAEEITVGFIDFGNKASVSFTDTKTLSPALQARPRHTVQVTLDGMPEKLSNEVVRLFQMGYSESKIYIFYRFCTN